MLPIHQEIKEYCVNPNNYFQTTIKKYNTEIKEFDYVHTLDFAMYCDNEHDLALRIAYDYERELIEGATNFHLGSITRNDFPMNPILHIWYSRCDKLSPRCYPSLGEVQLSYKYDPPNLFLPVKPFGTFSGLIQYVLLDTVKAIIEKLLFPKIPRFTCRCCLPYKNFAEAEKYVARDMMMRSWSYK